jgi:hypothetical protein
MTRYLSSHSSRLDLGLTRRPDSTEIVILRQAGLDDLEILSGPPHGASASTVLVAVRKSGGPEQGAVLSTSSQEWSRFVDSLRALLDPTPTSAARSPVQR